jgi:hypothetical protein
MGEMRRWTPEYGPDERKPSRKSTHARNSGTSGVCHDEQRIAVWVTPANDRRQTG